MSFKYLLHRLMQQQINYQIQGIQNNYYNKETSSIMSKPKPKDKKKEESSLLEKEIEEQKKELLEATFTIRKLQERLERVTIDNKDLNEKFEKMRDLTNEEIEKLKNIIDMKQEENRELLIKSSSNEIQKKQKEDRIRELEQHFNEQLQQKCKDLQNLRYSSINEIKSLQNKLKECEIFMNEKEEMDKDRSKLRQDLEALNSKRIEQLADKDREKVQATDKLKNDMLQKINETKVSLLSLRKQQLTTTTRLTVLQNHQLTSQLQYQSKQTQKLLLKNQELTTKVSSLQRDLQIHKEVQQQLAKRSHFSKNIIKKLSQRVKQLQQVLQSNKNSKSDIDLQKINQTLLNSQKNSQIISALQRNIEQLQKKCQKLQSDYTIQKNQTCYLQSKLQQYQGKVQKVGCLLGKYLDEILDDKIQVRDENHIYSLAKLKAVDARQWSKQDLQMTVILLLNLIKPFLNKRNVSFIIPPIKNPVVLEQEMSNTPILPRLKDSGNPQRKTEIRTRLNEVPLNIATKIVGSSLREWGKPVNNATSSTINLSRKYKIGGN